MAAMKSDPRKAATLSDIAKHCGVSVSTVSKVLAGAGKFRPETVKQVMKAVRALNYSPNAMARGMVMGESSKLVGFFVPNIMNSFFAELVDKVEQYLTDSGYMLTLCLFNDDPDKMAGFLRYLTESRASGAIIGSSRVDECKEDIIRARNYMHIVSIQGDVDDVDRIDVTDYDGTYEIIQYLIDKGHRKIGFVGYRYDISILQTRLTAYKDALRANGIEVREEYICDGAHDAASGDAMTRCLLDLPDPPTAIHCFNEFMAQEAYKTIRARGLSIPGSISVTGFDNIASSATLYPGLTTVAEPIDTMARMAVDMLLNRIMHNDYTSDPQHVFVKHKFIERESVAKI